MKRDNRGNSITMVHRWNRPPLSCRACREKKRRCDRTQPCSNCVLRKISCEYPGQSLEDAGAPDASMGSTALGSDLTAAPQPAARSELAAKLEEALAERPNPFQVLADKRQRIPSAAGSTFSSHYVTPFSYHLLASQDQNDESPTIIDITRKFPPLRQARELFDHFARTLQPTFGVLHIPSARSLMEATYECLLEGEEPSAADLMLLFSIFAGAALVWTPQLLEKLNSTREEAKAAFIAYTRVALAILDHPHRAVQASTTFLVATGTMAHLLMNTDGFPLKVHLLRHRCLLISREMQIHRLDTARCREERRLKGCDMIDIEVQRRMWWNMVASDWLLSFSGGPQEGAYTFQPKHMNVNLPSNTDDEFITSSGIQQEFPMSIPTSMSAFIIRVKSSSLCREVIDALPSILLDSTEPDYDTILALDAKFHNLINELPVHFRLDPDSVEQSRGICKERPYLAWQRVSIHFSIHTRLCRLHRPYHLEGIMNSNYAYSHMMCIRSAQTVLELRRSMDELDTDFGLKPARFWTVMHHVFFAALILAMDVSFNPLAPDAADRKAKVLAAYQTLEKSKQESNYLMEGIQKNLQTLMSTLQKHRPQASHSAGKDAAMRANQSTGHGVVDSMMTPGADNPTTIPPSSTMMTDDSLTGVVLNHIDEAGWEQLWSEFVAVAPELDAPQWNSLLENVDFNPQLDV
ncbi:uncharacterized protein N7482_000341 [Penicillium canariense]|uniref:Zn(2)-C6 fungal-type domain-containing protein n=1 Tax=Penicillium canariense TaxID=189055 RepID=A0A9W9IE03_9EURO|nr:uncharacterized protein N7482_000341 [Penicillium canariense]KAJ5174464.1 hypothetical protein N7482_000341 [Penicillium canariense]